MLMTEVGPYREAQKQGERFGGIRVQLHATIDLSNQPSEAPEMEHELVRIDVVSVAKIYGFITAALVTVFSFLFAFVDVMAPTGLGLAKWLMLIVVTGITGR